MLLIKIHTPVVRFIYFYIRQTVDRIPPRTIAAIIVGALFTVLFIDYF